jgi:hypothetical protein
MATHRQITLAVLVCFLWLSSGVLVMVSVGSEDPGIPPSYAVAIFGVLTLAMARSVHVLMDPDEKSLPIWALTVVLVLTLLIVVGLELRS